MGETEQTAPVTVYRIEGLGWVWLALAVAILYFVWIVLIATEAVRVQALNSIEDRSWVLSGIAIFAIALVLVSLHLSRKTVTSAEAASDAADIVEEAPVTGRTTRAGLTDEYISTNDLYQGKRVLEYSRPPKSQQQPSVFTARSAYR